MQRAMAWVLGSLCFLASGLERVHGADREPSTKRLSVSAECSVSKDDENWIVSSLASWERMQRELLPLQSQPRTTALFFDDGCVYRVDPLTFSEQTLRVTASSHAGRIQLPSGGEIPYGVASFAAPSSKDSVFLVMALPSVWEAASKIASFDMQLFLTAVLIHEMSHVVQFRTYLQQSAAVEGIELLGNSVNDDIIQERFAENESFSQSVDEEARLLFAAAGATSLAECRSLASRARAMMRSRQETYYVKELRALAALEDIFLTMEGSGQFAALAWLTLPEGAGMSSDVAKREFGERVRFWSQRLGLALFLVLERLSSDWRMIVYGDGRRTVTQLLDDALE